MREGVNLMLTSSYQQIGIRYLSFQANYDSYWRDWNR